MPSLRSRRPVTYNEASEEGDAVCEILIGQVKQSAFDSFAMKENRWL